MPGRYHDSWVNRTGPGDARPTAIQIVKDENRVGTLSDKVVVITGTSGGIGVETVRAMHLTGATVFATARKADVLHSVVEEILKSDPDNKAPIHEIIIDQTSFASVRKGAQEILEKSNGKVNILINNAGVMATPEGKTEDGWETQFGVCHLSHFLLFQLLKPALLASSTKDFNSRVVNVSSFGHRGGPVRTHDYNFTKDAYDPWLAYGQAKTANIWMANEISRLYGSKGLWAYSLHPGGINSGLGKHLDPALFEALNTPTIMAYYKSPAQGAATSVWAAVAHEYEGKPSKWLSNCEEVGPAEVEGLAFGTVDDGYAPHAFDEAGEKKLWADSCKAVGVENDS
ncbi:NAD(P)-binding protein [Microthyrium microscopicum]|uniref:NAD(P)-binding protein n=1 Tax=Microthyrium microscopicum TaxID=703497 RepID=A0A6A6UAW1_9PEZI|nr:NAD(P)-binding protein [Microthyrium microscopicum]